MGDDSERERWSPWPDEDPLVATLRLAVRETLTAAAPVAWDRLTDLGAWDFGMPMAWGGLEFGHAALAVLCEEVGASTLSIPVVDMLAASSLMVHAGNADALDAVRTGGVVAFPGRLPAPATVPEIFLTGQREGTSTTVSGRVGPFAAGVAPTTLLVLAGTDAGPAVCMLRLPSDGVEVRLLSDHGGGLVAGATFRSSPVAAGAVLLAGARAAQSLREVGTATAVHQAALLCGLTVATMTALADRLRCRRQFGKRLVEHQVLRLDAAALVARLDVVRLAVAHAAAGLDRSQTPAADAAGLLALTAELALDATRAAVHMHGAAGLARDSVAAGLYQRVAWESLRCGSLTSLWEHQAIALADTVTPGEPKAADATGMHAPAGLDHPEITGLSYAHAGLQSPTSWRVCDVGGSS